MDHLILFNSRLEHRSLVDVYNILRKRLIEEVIENEIVIVHIDVNSPDIVLYVPTIFAIISTSNAFHFVDSAEKIGKTLDEVGSRVVVTYKNDLNILAPDKIELRVYADKAPKRPPDDTVYLIKTSGSTGAAKTIYVTAASVVPNLRDMAAELRPSARDVILLSSPPTFDPHIVDVFLAFSSGATLLVTPRRLLQTQRELCLDTVTILHCTPSLLLR